MKITSSQDIHVDQLPEILFISTYPPRECGIATYSQDLINVLETKFGHSFLFKICALESKDEIYSYNDKVCYKLNTSNSADFLTVAEDINKNTNIKLVVVQHEFGFFQINNGTDFLQFLQNLTKPIILGFHTVLPHPDKAFRTMVRQIVDTCLSIIVMTNTSKGILEKVYEIAPEKIEIIPHGTHLVSNEKKSILKVKYGIQGRKILTTFGLISSGKSFETTLDALPTIVETNPEVLFLIIGKTHPVVIKAEGEKYRRMLEAKVVALHLETHVQFTNEYLSLPVLLEYLRLTDIYLFTSNDPNQAVSGTFSYAMSCGCPIISTPFPQAREMLDDHTGIIIDFQNSEQLSTGVLKLLHNETMRKNISINTLHKIAPTSWENSAIAHALLFKKILQSTTVLQFNVPVINLKHIKQLTTDFGMFQFSKINQPDHASGYTLDDNARALIAMCMHYKLTKNNADLDLMTIYLRFIKHCIQPDGSFSNYVNKTKQFTDQNNETNLEDSNGRAIWALGYMLSLNVILPIEMTEIAENLLKNSALHSVNMFSSRAMAFSIKGLYFYSLVCPSIIITKVIETLADRLVQMYRHESKDEWNWFESYLTYANSILPEAMLFAWRTTNKLRYLNIAKASFQFLLSKTFNENEITVISNKGWLVKGAKQKYFGEQPIDVAYTIMTLHEFYKIDKEDKYAHKLVIAFNWFLGNNHLHQIMYNPCTGGCFDGLEEYQVNLNQGAESTVSYLMARLVVEKYYSK